MIIIGILLLAVLLILLLFPKVFWAVHNYNTGRLRGKGIPGVNDLEMLYGEDVHSPVEQFQMAGQEGKTWTFFYPAALRKNEERYPVVVWGNGTGNTWVNYEASLRSLASYGFVVMGCDDSNMGDGKTLCEMAKAALVCSQDPESLFFGRLDPEKIAAAGHSQGACGAVNAVTKYGEDSSLFRVLFTTSLPKLEMCVDKKNMEFAYWAYDTAKISVPYFANTGTMFMDSRWISPLESMEENFSRLPAEVEAYGARQIGANHNIVNEYHGCGYFNAWFCYTLKGDKKAAEVFTGSCELDHNPDRWSDVILHPGNRK